MAVRGYSFGDSSTLHLTTFVKTPGTQKTPAGWRSEPVHLQAPQVFHTYQGIPYLSVGGVADGDLPLIFCESPESGARIHSSYGECHLSDHPEAVVAASILLGADHLLTDYVTPQSGGDMSVWLAAKDLLSELLDMDVRLPRSLSGSVEVPSSMDFRS